MIESQPHVAEPQPLAADAPHPLVMLSDAAASKLRELTAEESDPAVGLRVYVYSGGCSGFRYGMMLEDQPTPDDITIESKGIRVYIDPQSTEYLVGSEIDYLDTLMGAGFTVNNPNAVSACGCGSSFRTAESAGSPGACSH
jgi:iron-sulfur cluster assembly protein